MSQDQDPMDSVEDRWENLLSLIAQYGGERYTAGWQDHAAMIREQGVKRDATGLVGEPKSLIDDIVHEILKLQREMGDD